MAANPPNSVPLVDISGSAYHCGQAYADYVMTHYPGYRRYLDQAWAWHDCDKNTTALFEENAPFILDIFRGINHLAGPPETSVNPHPAEACTSFAVIPSMTRDKQVLAGQNKDTVRESEQLYIILRMAITDGPTMLVLAYPGEVLGYGLWSTGTFILRNNLYSSHDNQRGLTMEQWGLLTLSASSAQFGMELAEEMGIAGSGNCLIGDRQGLSANVEFNGAGVETILNTSGVLVHANHPQGAKTARFEKYDDPVEKTHSRHRQDRLYQLLAGQKGQLTVAQALKCLSDHDRYPRGICCHQVENSKNKGTTAAIIIEPQKLHLTVVRGNPCCNPYNTYTMYGFDD